MSKVDKEIQDMEDFMNNTFKKEIKDIHKTVVDLTPVDTGNLKKSINEFGVKQVGKDTLRIMANSRSEKYSYSIMIFGRRPVGNKMYGSLQLPDGILPSVRAMLRNKNIQFKIMGT